VNASQSRWAHVQCSPSCMSRVSYQLGEKLMAKKSAIVASQCSCAQVYYLPAYYAARTIYHRVHSSGACNLSWATGTGSTEYHFNLAPHHPYIVRHTLVHTGCMLEIQQLPRTLVREISGAEPSSAAAGDGLPPNTCSCPTLGQTIPCGLGEIPLCTRPTMSCIPAEPPSKKRK